MSVTPIRVFGEPLVVEGAQLLPRALQHETDHPDGILLVDRLAPEHPREVLRIARETDGGGGRPPVVRAGPHADAFGRR